MTTQRSQLATPGERALLAIGFGALTGAIALAHESPATGYELSIYAATPVWVWRLLGVAFALSLSLALATSAGWLRRLALCLGGGAAMVVAGMPVLRGYWFISGGDALTHLGWARGIASGAYGPRDLRYPGLHTVTTLVGETLGVGLAHAMMLVIVGLCGLFFGFVAMATARTFDSRYSPIFGAFSAFLLLPITTLSTFITPHSMSQAILFSAAFVFVLVAYLGQGPDGRSRRGYGLLAALLLVAIVLYHPQLAAHLLVVLFGICVTQALARRVRGFDAIARHTPIYGLTAVLAVAFLAWSATHELIQRVIRFHLVSTVEFLLGTNDTAGSSVGSQADSLSAVGGSLAVVVLKILGPHLVFGVLTGLLVLGVGLGVGRRRHGQLRSLVAYFTVGLAGLTVLFFLYFFGSSGMMYVRVFGFMMLFVTITGAVALAYGMEAITRARTRRLAQAGVAVAIGVLLVASLVGVFASPYVYKPAPHVTEQSMSEHADAFDAADDIGFVGIRSGPNRYADAHYAPLDRTSSYGAVTGEEIDAGLTSLESDRYLVVTEMDHERETIAYREIRYTDSQLSSVSTQPGVHRLQSSGEVTIYYVDSRS
ncbi:hypothetical protein [Halovivax cerinus]|uniref:Glycosyltransferase RgtA/B/C/D-like domain-containing protein n=1 Tax=Halovivax cerinus TaxID=1487865 RepID=A0ABD5NU23_9EURY|nr:hypothetical protein [Halovivax cerinus]